MNKEMDELYFYYKGDWYSLYILRIYKAFGFYNFSTRKILCTAYTSKIVGRYLAKIMGV